MSSFYGPLSLPSESAYTVDNKLLTHEYCMYLQRNAEELMELNRQQSYLLNGSFECKEPYQALETMLPESHKQVCNAQSCTVKHNY